MGKRNFFKKFISAALTAAFALSMAGSLPVMAASSADTNDTAITNALTDADIIDTSKTGSIDIYKYDETSAEKDGVYSSSDSDSNVTVKIGSSSYTVSSTGEKNPTVESVLGDYGIKGVEFSYVYCGKIEQYNFVNAQGNTEVKVVYEIDSALASILGLSSSDATDMTAGGVIDKCTNSKLHFTSDQLEAKLSSILSSDNTSAKNSLEAYAESNVTGRFADTDANGHTSLSGLTLGLYLIVETEVPEEVYLTTDPWFVSLPFTNVGASSGGDKWLYNAYCYPKNATDNINPTMEKTVRVAYGSESYKDFDGTAERNYVVSTGDSDSLGSTTTGTEATLISGTDFNSVLPSATYFKQATSKPSDTVIAGATVVSTNDSDCPIYLYVDGDTVYWYSDADVVYLNEDASFMFSLCQLFAEIDLSGVNTSRTTNMSGMFSACSSLEIIYVGLGWDVSNVTSSDHMFTRCSSQLRNYNRSVVDKTNANTSETGYLTYKEASSTSEDTSFSKTITASSGDILDYNIEVSIPKITSKATYFTEFTIKDVMSTTWWNNQIEVYLCDGNGTKTNITNKATITNSSGINIAFTSDGLSAINAAGIEGNCSVIVRYTTRLNLSSKLGDEGNANNVSLTWQRTSENYTNTIEDRCYVYSYGLNLTKYFSDNQGNYSNVKFLLYNKTDGYYVVADIRDEYVYYVDGGTNGDVANTYIGKTVSQDKATMFTPGVGGGYFYIEGLEADTYELIEIATDDGYKLLKDPVTISIAPTSREITASGVGYIGNDSATHTHTDACKDTDGYLICGQAVKETANGRTIGKTAMYVGDVTSATAKVNTVTTTMAADGDSANAYVVLSVTNTKGFSLPHTGGNETILIALAGCAVAFVAMAMVIRQKRR